MEINKRYNLIPMKALWSSYQFDGIENGDLWSLFASCALDFKTQYLWAAALSHTSGVLRTCCAEGCKWWTQVEIFTPESSRFWFGSWLGHSIAVWPLSSHVAFLWFCGMEAAFLFRWQNITGQRLYLIVFWSRTVMFLRAFGSYWGVNRVGAWISKKHLGPAYYLLLPSIICLWTWLWSELLNKLDRVSNCLTWHSGNTELIHLALECGSVKVTRSQFVLKNEKEMGRGLGRGFLFS